MRRRVLVSVLGVLGLALAAPPLWIAAHLYDPPPPDFAELTLPPPEGDSSALAPVAVLHHFPADQDVRGSALRARIEREPRWLLELLDLNEPAFAALERALAGGPLLFAVGRGVLSDPENDALLPVYLLVRLANLEAERLEAAGDRAGARERAQLGLRVGRKLSEAQGLNLLVLLSAASMQGASLDVLERQLAASPPTPAEARALDAALRASRWPDDAWKRMWAGEYRFQEELLDDVDDWLAEDREGDPDDAALLERGLAWLPDAYLWQPNRTRAELARMIVAYQAVASEPCRPRPELAKYHRPLPPLSVGELLRPNRVGRRIRWEATPEPQRHEARRCHPETRIELVRAQAAIRAFEAAEGALPERLEQLVPAYLDSVPTDAFGGGPLRYAPAFGVVYSIGSDFVDAGGASPPRARRVEEPAIRVRAPERDPFRR